MHSSGSVKGVDGRQCLRRAGPAHDGRGGKLRVSRGIRDVTQGGAEIISDETILRHLQDRGQSLAYSH